MRQRAKIIGIARHRLSTDGDGVTTLVAFHGCPLSCRYCLNPQSLGDGGRFREYSPEQLYAETRIDELYFLATNGGVTFGGGEPCLRPQFIREFRGLCGPEWRLNLETSLNVPIANVEALLPVVNTLIIDIKDTNPNIYRDYTGQSNALVLENLRMIADTGRQSDCIVRIPLIPGYNTDTDRDASRLKPSASPDSIYSPTKSANTDTMARGKQTCKILKEIRRQIAEANGIEFATSECRYKGDCLGTCPKCEAEVRYLEQQLRARSLAGKAVAIAGISAGMILMSGCSGTSTKKQANDNLLSEFIESYEMVEEVEDTDEGEMPLLEDSISCLTPEINCVKEGEISNETEVIVTQGEIPMEPTANPDEEGIYKCVEQSPQFPGGSAEMLRFIGKHLEYPEEQLKEGIQGRVVVQFYVDTLGRVCEPKIVRGKDSALDREALRVVRLFPNFTPGTLNGKKVNTYMTLPIIFKLPAN